MKEVSTVSVCSRTCTHSAASQPPTPHLSWSPSPSPSIIGSPRRSRSVLSLVNTSNTNLPSASEVPPTPTQSSTFGRRRKIVDEDDLATNQVYGGPAKDRLLLAPGELAEEIRGFQDEFGPGCGRLVCRKCCYEDVPR
ncbi:hypothetical protein JR316_0012685 [Psilocybe cubensis]|uniref:Uncharacterized protein n=1 Tax=Psilocybe cubensis TaxID=181762 RepID=A0ACB8GIZ2_PSICU|nr:hypothetical protein JR316_0012685 [Psilocybe cubensis]KAH9475569.1 hypothetical protein JR316_0012685 [Psilocybe cubensis]